MIFMKLPNKLRRIARVGDNPAAAQVMNEAANELERLSFELNMCAKLAADTPQFFNPYAAGVAKVIRDRVLSNVPHDRSSAKEEA